MLSLILQRAAQVHGRRLATAGDGPRTYRELATRVARLAGALRAGGLREGDRVAVLAGNGPAYLELYFAVAWAGGVIVPLNNRSHPSEMAFWIADSGARTLIVDRSFAAVLPSLCGAGSTVQDVIVIGDDGRDGYEARIAASDAVAPIVAASDALAGIFYTGGTTGRSKGVMLSHGNLVTNALGFMVENDYRPDTVFLHAAPMFHLADGASDFALTMAGATHAFLPHFSISDLCAAIERERVTNTVLVPTMIQRLLDDPALDAHDLSSLTTIGYGAAPMPVALLRRAMARLPGCSFIQAYGMTELSPVASVLPREYHVLDGPLAGKLGSAGRATFHVEIRVADPDGRALPTGSVGEVLVRGPTVMMGYWNRPEESAAAIRDGWMRTGDAGRLDEDGFLTIEDRLKDMIITGGENVYCAEVENALLDHPDVEQCAVIGRPSAQWGEAVHAVVVPRDGAQPTPDALIAHARDRLTAFKCPKTIELRAALPLTGAGKINKAALRDEAAG